MTERHRILLPALFVVLTLVRGLLYAAVIPPWQGPDEPKHFEYVRLLDQLRRPVAWRDADPALERTIIASMDRYRYWQFGRFLTRGESFTALWGGASHKLEQPMLPYVLYTAALSPVASRDIALQLLVLRIVSVLLGALVVLIAYLTARELFPEDDVMQIGIPAFAVFLPMHTFMLSTVNSDHLAEVFVSLAFFLVVKSFRMGLTLRFIVALGLTVLIAVLAKRTALFLVPALVAALPLYRVARGHALRWRTAVLVSVCLLVGLAAIGAVGIAWLDSTLPDTGSGLGNTVHNLRVYYLFLPSEEFPLAWNQSYLGAAARAIYGGWLTAMFRSFWGNFGWLKLPLASGWYWLAALIVTGSIIGLVRLLAQAETASTQLTDWQLGVVLSFMFAILAAVSIIVVKQVRSLGLDWAGAPQGRWLFPAIVPIATLLLLGWKSLVSASPRAARLQPWLLVGWILSIVVLDIAALYGYIVPFFYG